MAALYLAYITVLENIDCEQVLSPSQRSGVVFGQEVINLLTRGRNVIKVLNELKVKKMKGQIFDFSPIF